MAKYVDLYDSRNYYIGEDGDYQKWNIDPKVIEETANVVEIVRCKDCKYYGRADKRRFYRGSDCIKNIIDTIVPDTDFCSRGERRTE